MKVVYVTGCLGFIGYHITKKCLDNGWHVYGIDKETYASNKQLLPELQLYPNFKYLKIDINNYEQTELFDGKELMEMYKGYFDGMTVHSSGNIFTTGPGGLLVVSNEGKLMAKIDLGHLTNVTFDDDEGYDHTHSLTLVPAR